MTPAAKAQGRRAIRHLPGWQIIRRYREAGWTQFAIAEKAGVTQSVVSRAIYRRQTSGPAIERVWSTLEEVLG